MKIEKLLSGLAVIVSAIGAIIAFGKDSASDEDNLPNDLKRELTYRAGEYQAKRISKLVKSGEWSVEDVKRQLHRPDIDPDDWRDFEDGWRPEGW